jgi:3-dehydroquinate dehydratase I
MICISLAGISFQECVKVIGKADFTEIRIDQLQLEENQLEALFAMKKNTIATCRPGLFSDEKRMDLLKLAVISGAGYIDIEFEAPESYRTELVNFAHEKKAIVIISYHNFQQTPERQELENIIVQSEKMGADKIKIATLANSTTDNARILSLYESHTNLIAFCMGKTGMITRLAAPLLGAEFTFASLSKKLATAPGQLTYEEFTDIFDYLT